MRTKKTTMQRTEKVLKKVLKSGGAKRCGRSRLAADEPRTNSQDATPNNLTTMTQGPAAAGTHFRPVALAKTNLPNISS